MWKLKASKLFPRKAQESFDAEIMKKLVDFE